MNTCELCNFSSKYRSSYVNHLKTKKHLAKQSQSESTSGGNITYTDISKNVINFNVDGVHVGSYELVPELFDLDELMDSVKSLVEKNTKRDANTIANATNIVCSKNSTTNVINDNSKRINMNISSSFLDEFGLTVDDIDGKQFTLANVLFIQKCIQVAIRYMKV